jgi:putative NADPH-quinone reductase
MKILLYMAHPRLDRSEINRPMFELAQRMEGITCVDLYADYPQLCIDVDKEQSRLLAHDVIILQHPLFWYSSPAILKEWQDQVLEYGFAYGHDSHALEGKYVFNAVSCGAMEEAYQPKGANGADIRTLLIPFEKSFDLCRMHYLAPFGLFSSGRAREMGSDKRHLQQWQNLLTSLRDETLDLTAAKSARSLNQILPRPALQMENA